MGDNGSERLSALTGVRFVAAIHVVWFHYGLHDLLGKDHLLYHLIREGAVSVSLFYVLSGFILAWTTSQRHTPFCRRSFYQARFSRIYPIYLVSLVVALPLFLHEQQTSGQPLLGTLTGSLLVLTLLQSWLPQTTFLWNFPAWSLSNEIFFYALFPFIIRHVGGWQRRGLWIAGGVCLVASQIPGAIDELCFSRAQSYRHLWFEYWPVFRLPEFMLGVIAGQLFAREHNTQTERSCRRLAWLGTAALAFAIGMLVGHEHLPATWLLHNKNVLTPCFICLIVGLATQRGWLAAWLASPPLRLLGEASFSMYLLHIPVARWLRLLFPDMVDGSHMTWGFFALATAVTVFTSILTLYSVERPARIYLLAWFRQHQHQARSAGALS